MLLGIYNILWYICIPILYLFPRVREGFSERLGKGISNVHVDAWIQSASAGEALLVETMLKEIPFKADFSCMLTTWTKEGRAILERAQAWAQQVHPEWKISIRYFPFDTKKYMRSMCSAYTPNVVVLIETELWPILLQECATKHIPVCIINGRMSVKTVRWYARIQPIFSSISPEYICAISKDDAERFATVFPKATTTIMDNIKFTSIRSTSHIKHGYFLGRVALFASIRKYEFSYIVRCIIALVEVSSANTYVLVPRHPHHVHLLEAQLRKNRLPYTLCTALPPKNTVLQGIIIWDIFGTLSKLYVEATAVFVGGSVYKGYGGQNFLEPLACGKVPIVGPYIDNFIWAETGLEERGLLQRISTEKELISTLQSMLKSPITESIAQEEFSLWLASKQNGIRESSLIFQHYACVV